MTWAEAEYQAWADYDAGKKLEAYKECVTVICNECRRSKKLLKDDSGRLYHKDKNTGIEYTCAAAAIWKLIYQVEHHFQETK